MKTKIFLFSVLALFFAACNNNEPENKELLGTWSEPYHVNIYVKTITFWDNDTLAYTNKPDTTWDIVVDDAGQFAKLRYSVNNHQLSISGERIVFDNSTSKFVHEPFAFSTGYSIKDNVLTIDSFSYDGGLNSKYYKPVILYKSCEKPDNGDKGDFEPWMSMQLVKFTDDMYREYILAEYIGDNPVRMRGKTPPVVEELIVGTIPYSVKLSNGYWLIDWRWGNSFIYRPSNILLPYKWETLTHWSQTWDMPENPLAFDDYFEEVGGVVRRTIDNFLGINLNISRYSEYGEKLYNRPQLFGMGFMSEQDIPSAERENYYECVYQQDSLHEIYTQRLIEIINNGDFEKVYNKLP